MGARFCAVGRDAAGTRHKLGLGSPISSMKLAGSAPGGRPGSLQIAAIKGLLWRKIPLCFSLSGPGLRRDERVVVGGICPQSLFPRPCFWGGNSSAQPSPRAQGKTATKQQQSAHEQKNEKKVQTQHFNGETPTGTNGGGHTPQSLGPDPRLCLAELRAPFLLQPALFRTGIRNPSINRNKSGLVGCLLLIVSRCKMKTEMN